MKNKVAFRRLRILVVLILCLGLTINSCGSSSIAERDLEGAINLYYSAEKRGDWSFAYEMRVPEFRSSYKKDYYVNRMKMDSDGWDLRSWEIGRIKLRGESATVDIRFEEVVPEEFGKAIGVDPGETVEFDQVTEWRRHDGKWLCRACGMRMHLPLNGGI